MSEIQFSTYKTWRVIQTGSGDPANDLGNSLRFEWSSLDERNGEPVSAESVLDQAIDYATRLIRTWSPEDDVVPTVKVVEVFPSGGWAPVRVMDRTFLVACRAVSDRIAAMAAAIDSEGAEAPSDTPEEDTVTIVFDPEPEDLPHCTCGMTVDACVCANLDTPDADTGEAILGRLWAAWDADQERSKARRRVEEIDRDLAYLNFRLIDVTGAKYARAIAEIDRLESLKAHARAIAGLPEVDEYAGQCPATCPGCGGQGCPTY